jgi:co-chaperonin GroES (HSP10)
MLKPLGPRVIITPDDFDDADPVYAAAKNAGIVLQRDKREQQAVVIGTVVAIGSMAFHEPVGDGTPWCAVGDRVYYAKFAGKDITDPETKQDYLLLNDEDICALIVHTNGEAK